MVPVALVALVCDMKLFISLHIKHPVVGESQNVNEVNYVGYKRIPIEIDDIFTDHQQDVCLYLFKDSTGEFPAVLNKDANINCNSLGLGIEQSGDGVVLLTSSWFNGNKNFRFNDLPIINSMTISKEDLDKLKESI